MIQVQLQELDARLRLDANAARQETLQMCEGMKRITLPVSTDEEVRLEMLSVAVVQKGSLNGNIGHKTAATMIICCTYLSMYEV